MSILDTRAYIVNGDMSATATSGPGANNAATILGAIITTDKLEELNFSGEWAATGAPIGVINVWGTDDPRAETDLRRGALTATWTKMQIPTTDISGTDITPSGTTAGTDITTGGAGGNCAIKIARPMAFMCLTYKRTSAGAGNTSFNFRRAGRSAL